MDHTELAGYVDHGAKTIAIDIHCDYEEHEEMHLAGSVLPSGKINGTVVIDGAQEGTFTSWKEWLVKYPQLDSHEIVRLYVHGTITDKWTKIYKVKINGFTHYNSWRFSKLPSRAPKTWSSVFNKMWEKIFWPFHALILIAWLVIWGSWNRGHSAEWKA